MKENLEKIENWLKEHASQIVDFSLHKPATEGEILDLENVIGNRLPDDFKEVYFWHNGLNDDKNIGSLFYGMDFLPIDRIISEYNYRTENYPEKIHLQKTDKEIDPSDLNNLGWIKFAFDSSQTSLLLDLAPTSEGKSGQIIFIDDEYKVGILVANSTAELVENFKKDLEKKLYHLHKDALEDGNHYLETDFTIDIVNWETSEVWKR